MGLIIRSSAIHAAGCYTTAPIQRGTRLLEYTGPRISKERGDELYEGRPYTYLFGIGDGETVIDGHSMAMFINHSCDPNCETEEDDNGRVWVKAIRHIAEGEELTYDYCLYDGDGEEPCFCSAQNCRGTMYAAREQDRHLPARRPQGNHKDQKPSARQNGTSRS